MDVLVKELIMIRALKSVSLALSIPVILFSLALAYGCIVCAFRGVDSSKIFTATVSAFVIFVSGCQMARWGNEIIKG